MKFILDMLMPQLSFSTSLGTAFNADCFDIMRTLPNGGVDMILADLPYGTTACKWDTVTPFEPMWKEFHRIAKPDAAIVLTASQPFTSALVMSNVKMFKHEWQWIKNRGSNFANTVREPMKEHESVLVFSKGGWTYNKQMQERTGGGVGMGGQIQKARGSQSSDNYSKFRGKDVTLTEMRVPSSWQKFNCEVGLHPTQKPVALFEYLIKTYTNEDDLVFDPTAGSLTTGVAAENLNRRWICVEQDQGYFEKGVARFA